MPGYNQQQLNYKVRSANAVSILIGDQVVGFGQTTSPSQDYGTEALYGIGNPKPAEIQMLRFSQTITLDSFQLTAEGLQYFGINTPLSQILANNSFDLFILDLSGNAILSYVGCVASNYNINVPTNQIITEAITFQCLDVLGVDGQSILNGPAALPINTLASASGTNFSVPGRG